MKDDSPSEVKTGIGFDGVLSAFSPAYLVLVYCFYFLSPSNSAYSSVMKALVHSSDILLICLMSTKREYSYQWTMSSSHRNVVTW